MITEAYIRQHYRVLTESELRRLGIKRRTIRIASPADPRKHGIPARSDKPDSSLA